MHSKWISRFNFVKLMMNNYKFKPSKITSFMYMEFSKLDVDEIEVFTVKFSNVVCSNLILNK